MQTDAASSARPTRRKRTLPPPSNTLVIVLPPLLLSDSLLPLLHKHFESYGNLLSWTPIHAWQRVVAVYEREDEARDARVEMDGFVWEDDDEVEPGHVPQPIRIFYGPPFTISRLSATSSDPSQDPVLLTVPSSGKNFLISPPGSPPVGWEQTAEDAPNAQVFHPEDAVQPVQVALDGTFSAGWADELARALRFLSVDAGGGADSDDDDRPPAAAAGGADPSEVDHPEQQTTHLVLPPSLPSASSSAPPRPAVTVSSPAPSSSSSPAPSRPPGSDRAPRDIQQVKAGLESMLGRKRSMSSLRSGNRSRSGSDASLVAPPTEETLGGGGLGALGAGGGARITPTARPPLA
ncbi:hypothetical protein JCM10207_001831 [Rhodosporidiobolus poonsookiae]